MKFFCKLLLLFHGFLFCEAFSQKYNLTNNFNTENSAIAGNIIFDIVEDNNGFLWIATQNGISRFDGRNFYNYTTKDGLPSNDVLQIMIDQEGKIWVNCFRQVPSYFNEQLNRFVPLKGNNFEKLFSGLSVFSFSENNNTIIIIENKTIEVDRYQKIKILDKWVINIDNTQYFFKSSSQNTSKENHLELHKEGYLYGFFRTNSKTYRYKNCIFNIFENELEKYHHFRSKPFSFQKAKLVFEKRIKWQKITFDRIYLITEDNYFHVYDFDSFRLLQKIKISSDIKIGMIDKKGHFFAGTQNNGMQFLSLGIIKRLDIPKDLIQENFLSITINEKSEIFAGNFSGKILKYDGENYQKITLDDYSWIRKNLFFGKKTLTISDHFFWIDYGKKNSIHKKKNIEKTGIKRALKINDSIAILSTINGIYELNIHNNTYKNLHFPTKRIAGIIPINSQEYYVICAIGLFIYNHSTDTYHEIFEKYNFNEAAYDGQLLFVSTFQNELYVFKNNKLIKIISDGKNFPDDIGKLKIIGNRIWMGSKSGIFILDYKENRGIVQYKLENFNKNDGLISNDIYDFATDKENVFVATGKGISVVNQNISSTQFQIKTHVIAIKINGKLQKISSEYHLKNNEKDVNIVFSGVELSGHFKNFMYRMNDEKWNNFYGNTLNLNLENGTNTLEIKALDNNDTPSTSTKKVTFHVMTPFHQTIWFWVIMGGLIFGGIFGIYGRWKFVQQKEDFKHQLALELQRNKITADLHDDLGATLSSIQINSMIACKIMKDEPDEASKILNQIEKQSKKISENIGDIIWSLKPGKDELMTITTRIKNFANEILGNTNINFVLNLDEAIDTQIKDFAARKNIILIVKEALNNCVKYSNAKNVVLNITKKENKYILEIIDDGIGFDVDAKKGNGIANMQRRAEEVGAAFSLKSQMGKTHLVLDIPIIRD